jgi:hypothetical protein
MTKAEKVRLEIIDRYVSRKRFSTYLKETNNDFEKAIQPYQTNIQFSEAFYPLLSILEISLRNAINHELKAYFKNEFWFKDFLGNNAKNNPLKIINTMNALNQNTDADSFIAELNFGFWTNLFSGENAKVLWQPLRLVFKHLPKNERKRKKIADCLHRIRKLRNRIYHYEPIIIKLNETKQIYDEIKIFIGWINKEILLHLIPAERINWVIQKNN